MFAFILQFQVGRESFYLHFHLLDIKGISVLLQIDAFLLVVRHAKLSGGFPLWCGVSSHNL